MAWIWNGIPSTARNTKRRSGGTGPNPTDRAKGGVKRSLQTEAQGIPIGLVLDGANRYDMKLVESTLQRQTPAIEAARAAWAAAGAEQHLCLDAGDDQVRETVAAHGYTAHIRGRGEEKKAKQAGQRARPWVVERTHSWLNRYRHLLIRWAKKPDNYLAMLHCACLTWNCCLFG